MSFKSKAYEGPLPALAVRGPELRKSLTIVTASYMLATVHIACISGSQINVFGEMLGFNDFAFGLLTAIPFLATFAQIASANLVDRTGLRKHQIIYFQSMARFGWIGIATIGLFMPLPSPVAVVLMLALYTFMCAMDSMASPPWWTWMADLIPRRIRSRYMATREAWSNFSRLLSFVAVGVVLDLVSRSGEVRPGQIAVAAEQPLLLYTICGLFIVAGVFGAAVMLFHRVREIVPTVRVLPGAGADAVLPTPADGGRIAGPYAIAAAVRGVLVEPWSDRLFRRFTAYYTVLNVSSAMCAIYVWRVALNHIGFSKLSTNIAMLLVGAIAAMISMRWIGRLIDRFGRRPVLIVATVVATLWILSFAFLARGMTDLGLADGINRLAGAAGGWFGRPDLAPIPPGAPVGAYVLCCTMAALGGVAWSAVTLAQTSFMLHFGGAGGKGKHIAAFAVITSLGGLLGGVAGGALTQWLEFLQQAPVLIGSLALNNWHIAILAASAVRLSSVFLLLGMPDPGARRLRELLGF